MSSRDSRNHAAMRQPVGKRNLQRSLATALLSILLIGVASAETKQLGGDTFMAQSRAAIVGSVAGDAFVAGFDVELDGEVAGDAHAVGFSVEVRGLVGKDLYVQGGTLNIYSRVGEDLSAAGATLDLSSQASVGRNARLSGGTVEIGAPIAGSLLAAGGTITLDAVIQGDAHLYGADIEFGENAQVLGKLLYSAPEPLDIPASVAQAGQIEYRPLGSTMGGMRPFGRRSGDIERNFWPSLVSGVMVALIVLVFLLVISAIFLAFAPERIERMRRRAIAHAGYALLFGFLGLSALFGSVLVSAGTLIGLPLVPVILVVIPLLWTLGFLLGIYVIATRLWQAFDGSIERLVVKLTLLTLALILAAAFNFIPFFGWILNLAILFFGLGSMTLTLLERLVLRAGVPRLLEGQSG